jgi:hypothetical protein
VASSSIDILVSSSINASVVFELQVSAYTPTGNKNINDNKNNNLFIISLNYIINDMIIILTKKK